MPDAVIQQLIEHGARNVSTQRATRQGSVRIVMQDPTPPIVAHECIKSICACSTSGCSEM